MEIAAILLMMSLVSDVDEALEKAKRDTLPKPMVVDNYLRKMKRLEEERDEARYKLKKVEKERDEALEKLKKLEDPYARKLKLKLAEYEIELADYRARGFREDYVSVSTLKDKIRHLKKVINGTARSDPSSDRSRSNR